MASRQSDAVYDRCHSPAVASPSDLSSPGNTVDDSPFPATPSSLTNPSSARSPIRRRGRTISTISDVDLLNHAIFSLSMAGPEQAAGTAVAIADDHNDQAKLESQGQYDIANDKDEKSRVENSVDCSIEDPSNSDMQFSSHDAALKDLAKHGVPSACVFVANLAASQTDDQLMKSLQTHFGKFGRLHVKIRRDLKGNPYSFCQFESDAAARLAVREGRNAVIDVTGRRIRCEPAKVNRTLVLSRHDGVSFDEAEARKILFGFGKTEAMEFAVDVYSLPVRGLKNGPRCFIRFVYRQDAVDCYQYFRFHGTWTAEWTSNFSTPNIVPQIQPMEIDPFSLFVGRLNPARVTEQDLKERFAKYGTILECNLLNRASKNGAGRNAFAFIKFESEESATTAMDNENDSHFLGTIIQVQKREVHKKSMRGASATSGRFGGNKLLEDRMNPNFSAPAFCFSLKDVASLAAHLSLQFANKPDQNRRQSVASVASNTTAYGALSYPIPPESLSARRGSYQSTAPANPGFMFHQPFQKPYGINNPANATEAPVSPRTAQSNLPGIETHIDPSFGPENVTPTSYGGIGHPQYQNQPYFSANFSHSNSHNDPYCGAFPPSHQHAQFPSSGHLAPHVNAVMAQPSLRDNVHPGGYDMGTAQDDRNASGYNAR